MAMQNHPDFLHEQAYLKDVLTHLTKEIPHITKQKEDLEGRVSYAFAHMNVDNPESYSELTVSLSLLDGWKLMERQMLYAQNKPYFARVDFDGKTFYIGKMTLLRQLDVLITDWRAPLATLYYEGRIGEASYDCLDGHITGELSLKRQYQIENGVLENFIDIDITANDTFLQAALGASKDRRLRDIVTTIQAEQNRIIRAPLQNPLIVQGVAGSGKTTIALHRIAYLLYTHADILPARQVMIIAPSLFFLSYISDVLPELGVEQVVQTTFADFVASCLDIDLKKQPLTSPLAALSDAINSNQLTTPRMVAAGLKGSLRFHQLILRYLRYIEERLLPAEDFGLEGYALFSRKKIIQLFTETYTFLPTNKRAAEIEKYLTSTVKRQLPRFEQNILTVFDKHMQKIKTLMPEDTPARREQLTRVLDKRDAMLKQLHETARPTRKKYMKAFKLKTALTYYKTLFSAHGLLPQMAQGIFTPEECRILAEQTQLVAARGALEPEDLPPLLFMQKHLFGMKGEPMKHVVIDEAQDYSPFQFLALREALPAASFSVLGDLHQGLLAHKGVNNWDEIRTIIEAEPLVLTQSYRTTIEIMEAANPVITQLYPIGSVPAVPLAVPVIRHGEAVIHRIATDKLTIAMVISEEIKNAHQAGCRSIAVITKTAMACEEIQKALTTMGENYPLIAEQENDYQGGVLLLPVYLAKGLEFDAVIITDVALYTTAPLDVKLLYIAMTRALHKLVKID